MKVSTYSDYSLRVLMQAALQSPNRVTVDEVAQTYGISRNHLIKVVHELGRSGFLVTHRGVGGGFTLACAPEGIRLGEIIRLGEETDTVIDCKEGARTCRMLPACRLRGVFDEAAAAFFAVLDRYTLADLVKHRTKLRSVLEI